MNDFIKKQINLKKEIEKIKNLDESSDYEKKIKTVKGFKETASVFFLCSLVSGVYLFFAFLVFHFFNIEDSNIFFGNLFGLCMMGFIVFMISFFICEHCSKNKEEDEDDYFFIIFLLSILLFTGSILFINFLALIIFVVESYAFCEYLNNKDTIKNKYKKERRLKRKVGFDVLQREYNENILKIINNNLLLEEVVNLMNAKNSDINLISNDIEKLLNKNNNKTVFELQIEKNKLNKKEILNL